MKRAWQAWSESAEERLAALRKTPLSSVNDHFPEPQGRRALLARHAGGAHGYRRAKGPVRLRGKIETVTVEDDRKDPDWMGRQGVRQGRG